MRNVRAYFDLLREYAGGLLRSGDMAIHKNNEIYFGVTDKKTVKLLQNTGLLETTADNTRGQLELKRDEITNSFGASVGSSGSRINLLFGIKRIDSTYTHYSNDATNARMRTSGEGCAWYASDDGVNGEVTSWNVAQAVWLWNASGQITAQIDTGGTWDNPMILNSNGYIWNDGTNMRGKVGTAPTSSTDGTIIV